MATNVFPVDAVAGAPEYTGREARQVLSALVGGATAARPLGGRSGVRPGPTAVVSASGGDWTVNPHNGVLDLQTAVEASCYLYATDAASTPSAITAAHATYARKDIVYVKLDDPAESDGSSVPAVTFLYTAGTASASPAAPATPARSMVLAEINVPNVAGGGASSATVTQVWPTATATGGIVKVRNTTERNLLTSTATAENPIYVHRADATVGQRLEVCDDGTNWRTVAQKISAQYTAAPTFGAAVPAGTQLTTITNPFNGSTNPSGLLVIPFPVAFPTAVVSVQVTPLTGFTQAPLNGRASVTTSQATVVCLSPTGAVVGSTSVDCMYTVIGY